MNRVKLVFLLLLFVHCDLINFENEQPETRLLVSLRINDNDPGQIYTLDLPSKTLVKITSEKNGVRNFDWNIQTSKIVYPVYDYENHASFLKTINSDGSDSEVLKSIDSNRVYGFNPRFSPDGKNITFTRGLYNYDIYNFKRSDNSIIRLTEHLRMDRNPIWSSDNQRIYFESEREGTFSLERSNLFSIDPDGSNLSKITNEEYVAGFLKLNEDNDVFIYSKFLRGTEDTVVERYFLNLESDSISRVEFTKYEEQENHRYSVVHYKDDATKILIVERHQWNRDNGSTLYEWNTETGELTEMFKAYAIGKVEVIYSL